MMKWMTGVVLAAMVSAPATAQPRRAVRQVQLIAMGGVPVESADGSPASTPSDRPLPPDIPGFAVHDLSRRYVEYRMANELRGSASALPAPVDSGIPALSAPASPVSAASPISVPFWMQPAGTLPAVMPVRFTPGCAPLAYRPSGLLSRDAEGRRAGFYAQMSAIACEHGIPVGLFDAVIMRESRYNPVAVSPKQAFGLTQLMPGTASGLGVNRFSVVENLRGGARYLRQQLDRFGHVHLALAAYNAGPGRVRGGQIPRIAETQGYVANILANWSRLSGVGRAASVQSVSATSSRVPPMMGSRGIAMSSF